MNFTGAPIPMVVIRTLRVALTHPSTLVIAGRWVARVLRRAGGPLRFGQRLLAGHVQPMTFVMHSFMDAQQVQPAWEQLQRGQTSVDPEILATQQRLQACSYAMAHPETGELVPACVQHSVLDPGENVALRHQLPIVEVGTPHPG
jgi:hypothetical protein